MENQETNKQQIPPQDKEEKPKTQEELEFEEQLKKRLEELRRRDPFIYR